MSHIDETGPCGRRRINPLRTSIFSSTVMSPVCSICFAAALRLSWCSYSSSLHHRTEMMSPSSSVKEMTSRSYPAMPTSSEITPIAMFLDQRPCYVLTRGQRVVHTVGGVLDILNTEYPGPQWPFKLRWCCRSRIDQQQMSNTTSSNYTWWSDLKISQETEWWTIPLHLVEGVRRWSAGALFDQASDRGLASQFKAATLTPRWEGGTLVGRKPCLIRPAI
jgi:hypothetical protein